MNRRHFLATAGLMGFGTILLNGQSAFAAKKFCAGDINVPLDAQIGHNHGHRLLVPRQDVLDGKDKSYDIQGSAGHGHVVIITQELFAELRLKGTMTVESGGSSHTHPVTLVCAN